MKEKTALKGSGSNLGHKHDKAELLLVITVITTRVIAGTKNHTSLLCHRAPGCSAEQNPVANFNYKSQD